MQFLYVNETKIQPKHYFITIKIEKLPSYQKSKNIHIRLNFYYFTFDNRKTHFIMALAMGLEF